MAAETIHLRLPDQTREKLERLAAVTNRPRTYHISRALDRYLEEEIWQIGHIQEGVADLDAGRTTPHEDVMAEGRRIISAVRDSWIAKA
jgi:predicted transcriptional regulator